MDNRLAPGTPFPVQLKLLPWAELCSGDAVDYHLHTAYTDGMSSPKEIANAAVSKGIKEVLFSEHVRYSSTYYSSFVSEVKGLRFPGLNINVGVETKVLDLEGHLDCSTHIVSMCDAVIGSVHSPPSNGNGEVQSWSQLDAKIALNLEFQLALSIITKSRAHILGHPMGMVITNFSFCPPEYLFKLACACREFDKAFELNTRYCPNPKEWIDVVRQANCKVSIGSDAHATSQVGNSWNLFVLNKRYAP